VCRSDINPHIPQYITKVPFFYGTTGYAAGGQGEKGRMRLF
jgi:hypothetical protein